MHILFLTDNFPPEVNAPAQRTLEHCLQWVNNGHQVTVITSVPNFPKGIVYPGYKNKFWQKEFYSGIKVVRVWTYMSANEGFYKRTLDYTSYLLASFIASLFIKRVDIIIGTSPQFFTALSAYLASVFKRKPWIFELRDIWPDSIMAVGAIHSKLIFKMLKNVELFLYRRSNLIVVVTHSFKKYLLDLKILPTKISVVTNGYSRHILKPAIDSQSLRHVLDLREKFLVGYIGTHGLAHNLETILGAAKIIANNHNEERVHFIFLGDGAEKAKLMNIARDQKIENVTFLNTVSRDLVSAYWGLLDVSVIHLKRTQLFEGVIPSKLFESMAMGVPVLHGVAGESAEIVRNLRLGLEFDAENPSQLALAILEIKNSGHLNEYRKNCLASASQFTREVLAEKMLNEILRVKNA